MRKILTTQIWEKIHYSLISRRHFQRHRKTTTYRSTYLQRNESKTEKFSYSVYWLQKGPWYGLLKLDYRLSQNVQNKRRSHKMYRESHENLESGIEWGKKKLCWGKNPECYIPGRCAITVDDVTQSHIKEIQRRIQTEKINHLKYMDDIKLFTNNETLIQAVKIYS